MSAPKQELGSEFGGQEFFNIGLGGQKLFSNFAPKQELGNEFGGRSFSISVWEGRSFFPTSFPSSRLGTYRDTHGLRFFIKNIRCVVCPLPSRSLGASLGGRSFSISVWEGRSFFPTSFPSSRLGTFRDLKVKNG